MSREFPPITHDEFLRSPLHGDVELWRRAWGHCRVCSAPVRVCVEWGDDEPVAMSSGRRPGCEHPACGDKMPASFIRMLDVSEMEP